MRQSVQDPVQILQFWNADTTNEDLNHFMKQTPTGVQDQSLLVSAFRLFHTVEAVVDHKVATLRDPIARPAERRDGAQGTLGSPCINDPTHLSRLVNAHTNLTGWSCFFI